MHEKKPWSQPQSSGRDHIAKEDEEDCFQQSFSVVATMVVTIAPVQQKLCSVVPTTGFSCNFFIQTFLCSRDHMTFGPRTFHFWARFGPFFNVYFKVIFHSFLGFKLGEREALF